MYGLAFVFLDLCQQKQLSTKQKASNIWQMLAKSYTFASKSLQCDNRTLII